MTNAIELPVEVDCHTVQSLQQSSEDFLFLDCREPDEYQTTHINGTMLLPMSELQARITELDGQQQRRIVVHCHRGGRSLRVARWMRAEGFTQVQSMAGGIDAWSEQIDTQVPRY